MKKFLLSALLLVSALSAGARGLLIKTKAGVEVYFPITDTDRPVMRFLNAQVWVDGKHYQFGDIAEFRLVDADPTGIDVPTMARRAGNIIVLATTAPVSISDLGGRQVEASVSSSDTHQTVDVSGLAKGTYVVKAGKCSFKFVKK